MEEPELKEPMALLSATGNDARASAGSATVKAANSLAPQACPTCGTAPAAN